MSHRTLRISTGLSREPWSLENGLYDDRHAQHIVDFTKGPSKGAGSVIAEGTPDLPLIAADLHSSATAHASVNA